MGLAQKLVISIIFVLGPPGGSWDENKKFCCHSCFFTFSFLFFYVFCLSYVQQQRQKIDHEIKRRKSMSNSCSCFPSRGVFGIGIPPPPLFSPWDFAASGSWCYQIIFLLLLLHCNYLSGTSASPESPDGAVRKPD